MIKDSVSIILKLNDKLFLIKRKNSLRSFPGYTAFPGGKIDVFEDADYWFDDYQDQAHILAAARREIQEELGFDFALDENVISIDLIGEATSPDFNPRRFRNYYVLVCLRSLPNLKCCSHEIESSSWYDYKTFLDEFNRGELLCVKPMFTIFDYINSTTIYSFQNFRPEFKEDIPQVEMISGLIQIMPLSNTVPPATRTNCFFINDIIIDPSPKDEVERDKLLLVLKKLNLNKIIISHHHGDHHQYASDIAKKLKLPIYISKDSYNRIINKNEKYFEHIIVKFLEEGMVLTTWKSKAVTCYAIPGHDEGHFGFAPLCLSWFIVGDLFQGVGTVVVGGDEGDMDKYLKSLERVINLNPKAVIPSHGIALGGVDILEKTLKHRLLREKQIIDLLNQGKKLDEMLSIIYFDLPEKLHKYARANIQSHYDRIVKLSLI